MNIFKLFFWNKLPLPYKLFLVYTPLIIIPVISGSFYLTSKFNESNRNTVTEYSEELLELISGKIDDRMSVFEDISFQLLWVPEIQRFLQNPPVSPYENVELKASISNRVDAITAGKEKKSIKAVVLISDTDRLVIGEDDKNKYFDDDPSFVQIALSKKGRVEWFLPQTFTSSSLKFDAFRLARVVRNEKLQNIGLLYLVLDTKIISDFFKETKLGEDVKWQMQTATGEEIVKSSTDIKRDTGKEPIMISHTLNHFRWLASVYLPLNDLYKTIDQMNQLTLWIALFFLLIGLLATYILAIDIIVPLRRLKNNMKQGIKGVAPSSLRKFTGTKELVELNDTFISVMYEIQQLILEVVKNQSLKRNAEIKALQNQLSPHFLYNALNSIRWMAMLQNQHNIKEMIDSLSQLLTYSMRKMDELVPIHEELSALNDYINIQKVGQQNFQFNVDMHHDLRNIRVLKFLIQPLIENSLVHGLAQINCTGKINVTIYKKDLYLMIHVIDNGCGISPDKLEEIVNRLNGKDGKEPTKHIGLRNVHERIQLHYGQISGLSIDSAVDKGTRVTITLPWEGTTR
ncbi:MAG: sensor histidine kinase [Paenibacillaceae bacterium]